MRKIFILLLFCLSIAGSSVYAQNAPGRADTLKNPLGFKERQILRLGQSSNPFYILPSNLTRDVQYDPKTKMYIVRDLVGDQAIAVPQYLTIDEYQRLINAEMKQDNWRTFSNAEAEEVRRTGIIPSIRVNSRTFEKIFGGTNIDIKPVGQANLTFLGRINKNENPLFNERQRVQGSFDFNQQIQMGIIGNIGTKMKVNMNYNTEAQFDFENQVKLEYTGGEDEIIRKIEAGNVSLPLNTSLITGTQALFGVKTQLQFGKLNISSVFSQQRSQTREIRLDKGAQQTDFSISSDEYEANKHYFLAKYFRDNYNKALANPPTINSGIQITKIEVWITNKTSNTQESRDVLAFLDLGENQPYNTAQVTGGPGFSGLPAGFDATGFPQQSNNLLQQLAIGAPNARFTNSNDVISFFQANGATDNFAKLTYARKLTEREYVFQPQLGYISLNSPLNSDEVLAVAYRYTYNGVEYQVGEFSTDVSFDANAPKVLFAKLLKNETVKTNLPTWDLMMKNIYYIRGNQISSQNFRLDIFRVDDATGVERPVILEGQNTQNKQWINILGLDRLNQQNERRPDGVFDFEAEARPFNPNLNNPQNTYSGITNNILNSGTGNNGLLGTATLNSNNTTNGYVTIDPINGRVIFPVIEPFGADLASQFNQATEQGLIDKYTYPQLYDSTQVIARQLFTRQNKFLIKGSYQSEFSSEISLNTINVTEGSVKVFSGTIPLVEGVDYTVNTSSGTVKILNTALLTSGQPIRISTENNEMFGLQQRSLFGTRLDYRVNGKLNIGGTLMNLTEKPLTAKVNIGEEPISNTIYGFDLNYSSPSRFLTRLVDKLPFLSTKAPSSITFSAEFAQLLPGHPSAINGSGKKGGVSYLDDFEAARSIIDLKSANVWQLSGTPQMFPESQLVDNLASVYNRAKAALYNIDPIFYGGGSGILPDNLRNNRAEFSNHYVRQVIEQEVFPFKEIAVGQNLNLPTLDLAYYPMLRGPYNFATTGFSPNGNLLNPRQRWAGFMRPVQSNDFEALNIGFIEAWIMDPFIYKPGSQGGDLYLNIGNISEDILRDGRKALENALPANGDPSKYDETNFGRVTKLQPVVQAFDNDPAARKAQDVGLDGLSDADERIKFAAIITQIKAQLNPDAAQFFDSDPSSDNYSYFRGAGLDQENAGILRRYLSYNGPEGNSKTSQQSMDELGLENSASTALPDGEDINRDNNMTQSDEYFQYKISIRPGDLVVGQNYVADKVVSQVKLANGQTQAVTWYQIRIPIGDYQQKVGGIQDFKSIRFFRMFLTDFADTVVLRFAKLQLVRGDWRVFNQKNESSQIIVDQSLLPVGPDNSSVDVATVNIEENGKRVPIPYVLPPGIERERDFSNYNGDTRQNEQSLSVTVKNLRDGYGRAVFKTGINDLRSYKRLEMFVHLEDLGSDLQDNDLSAFIRIGTDNQDNYYEYSLPLKVTQPGTSAANSIWPDQNRMDIELELFQKAKTARNAAKTTGGLAWPINVPFTYVSDGKTVVIKGQPDMSKVKVFMLGLKNPLRNPAAPGTDDGLEKSGLAWFNELRLTEFDERGGWAATARMTAKLADFGDVNISGSKSTIGFGSIEKRVSERNRSDNFFFDVSSSMELGNFLPKKSGVKIPFFISYSNQTATPQYDPRTQDIELKESLRGASKATKDSILNYAQDYTVRSSINFTNVHKERTSDKPVRIWDIENLSASYGSTTFSHRDFIIESNIQRTYRASLSYNYSADAKNYQPFAKLIRSNMLSILRDFNFSPMPKRIGFSIDLNRFYSENNLRNNDPNNYIPINTTFNKNFLITRVYGIGWDLTKSLALDFDATNYSIVDEPDGRINGLKRDTLWENLKMLGRTTDYNHTMNVRYRVPINKIRYLDWITLETTYGTNFTWQTEPLSTLRDPHINLGNTIQNTRIIQVKPQINFAGLYQKFGFLKRANEGDSTTSGFSRVLLNLVTSVRSIGIDYNQSKGIFLPGYLPATNYFGIENATGAPGLGFVFGSQRDIRQRALENGWLTNDTLQNQLYINTMREDIRINGVVEPVKDFRINIFATRSRNLNFSTNFRYEKTAGTFVNLSPITTGDYSISFISIGTLFTENNKDNVSKLFNQFMANRQVISQRLGVQNPNSGGTTAGFADGYDKNSQDVLIPAFLAAYTGQDAGKRSLRTMPKIPIPNWRVSYAGLTKIPFFADRFSELIISHAYKSSYSINGFNSLIRYRETGGFSSVRDNNNNFLPLYQFSQVTISEQLSPLIGVSAKLQNNVSVSVDFDKTRLLGLSLANTQLAQLSENNLIFEFGYKTNNFRFPFGLFRGLKLNNLLDFKMAVSVRDNKTVIFRPDVAESEVYSGAKNIAIRPTVDYTVNDRFSVRLFYDSNITKPYTSQTFNTSYSNFGFTLSMIFN